MALFAHFVVHLVYVYIMCTYVSQALGMILLVVYHIHRCTHNKTRVVSKIDKIN